MTKKTILLVIPLLSGAALVAQGPPPGPGFGPRGRGFGMGPGLGPGFGRALVTGAPYSATETVSTVQTLANGNTITHKNVTQVYRDSQGRMRTETTITPPPESGKSAFTEIVISDPVSGNRYMLNSSTMTAIQMPMPKLRAGAASGSTTRPAPPERPGVTVTTTDLGTKTVNGVNATGKQVTETIAPGTIGNAAAITGTRTSWVATDLKVPVSIQNSDPRFGNTDMELTNIVTSEPDASLFQVPSNYTIKTGGGRFGGGFGPNGGRGFHRQPPQQ
jgi:hypothetical protein